MASQELLQGHVLFYTITIFKIYSGEEVMSNFSHQVWNDSISQVGYENLRFAFGIYRNMRLPLYINNDISFEIIDFGKKRKIVEPMIILVEKPILYTFLAN